MNGPRLAGLITFMLFTPLTLDAQTGRWTESQSAIVDLIQRTATANNARNVDAWMALFADDAVYMAPGAPAVTTREGLRAVAEAGVRHRPSIQIEPVEIVVTESWAFARSRVSGTVVDSSHRRGRHRGREADCDLPAHGLRSVADRALDHEQQLVKRQFVSQE
jgi:uncharacterized protein (TIGR02246 family)